MAATRRQAREWALQLICQAEANPPDDLDAAIEAFWHQQWLVKRELERAEIAADDAPDEIPADVLELVAPAAIREFAEVRMRGVLSCIPALDSALEPWLDNWDLYRLGTVERNVLRLGAWELLNCQDVPPAVAINEAVDLAKYFSSTEAGHFVNGVLDRFRKQHR